VQTSTKAKISSKSDQGFESRFPDPDVSRIVTKMQWIHSLVSISHFAKKIGWCLYEKC